jgi:hypothetical protein
MTSHCLDDARFDSAQRHLHDAVLGVVVAVVFILPAALAVFALL